MPDDIRTLGVVSRVLPGINQDGTQATVRLGRYGDQYTHSVTGSKLDCLANEGSYFVATNATLGTALTGTAAPTAFSATVALVSLFNAAATGGRRIHLDWLLLSPKAAGTNGTNFSFAMSGDRINRYSSGGTAITPVNVNMDSDTTSIATMNVGAITAAAAGPSVRRLHHGILRTVIKVIGDQYLFTFGNASPPVTSGIPLEGTLQAAVHTPCPPVIIGPGQSFLFHEIAAAQSVAATWEFACGWWER